MSHFTPLEENNRMAIKSKYSFLFALLMLDIDPEHNHQPSQLILLLSADVKALKVKDFNHAPNSLMRG